MYRAFYNNMSWYETYHKIIFFIKEAMFDPVDKKEESNFIRPVIIHSNLF